MRVAATLVASLTLSTTVLVGQAAAAPVASADTVPAACPVVAPMYTAADYWLAHGTDLASASWKNAVFHVGNLAMVLTSGQSNHKTLPWAQALNYQLDTDPAGEFNPANEAAGEAYLDLYTYFHPDPPILAALRQRVADEVASVQAGHVKYWNTVDALNQAWPQFVRLGVMDNKPENIKAAQDLFHYTEKRAGGFGLFNELTGLWYHDASQVGTFQFWSRGNGEALAALATVLQWLPKDDPNRPEYVRVFQKMADTLRLVQRNDGFWNVDLLNPFDHPGPESSGTAFFTYALGWGVNNGILDAKKFTPTVTKGWNALTTKALQPSGLFGYVQGDATGPHGAQPVKATDSGAYAVGAYLMAGQQVAKLTPGC
ncbi:glycoside hydrolase family 88 protein [Kutzneria sp. NPDC051319]|uniref:glycoside hydrolase family 88 protein n=1 Tax=Kutzneria sp. NPDC051319 TaxID=3155047 RepID=UPI00341F909F